MVDKLWLGKTYLSGSPGGASRNSRGYGGSRVTASTIYAVAVTDSENGMVTIEIDGTQMDVPCVCSVKAGQRVIVSLVSGSPVVIGAAGWGDGIDHDIADAGSALGQPAVSVGTSTEVIVIPCDSDGAAVTTSSADISFWAYSGEDRVACDATVSNLPQGMTAEVVAGTDEQDGTVTVTVEKGATLGGADLLSGIADLVITALGKEFTRNVSWAKALAGKDGEDGISTESNYLHYDEARGLVMCTDADNPDMGISTQIQSTGLTIRSGTTPLSRFTPNVVYLGMASDQAVVDLINGTGEIRQRQNTSQEGAYSTAGLDIRSQGSVSLTASNNGQSSATVRSELSLDSVEQNYLTTVYVNASAQGAPDAGIMFASRAAGYSSTVTIRGSSIRQYDAGRYNAIVSACVGISTQASVQIPVGTITQIPITGFSSIKPVNSVTGFGDFAIQRSGVQCQCDGYVLVCGSVYLNTTASAQSGCYVRINGSEAVGVYADTGGGPTSTASRVVKVNAGDLITLHARSGTATTVTANDINTYLTVVYV